MRNESSPSNPLFVLSAQGLEFKEAWKQKTISWSYSALLWPDQVTVSSPSELQVRRTNN